MDFLRFVIFACPQVCSHTRLLLGIILDMCLLITFAVTMLTEEELKTDYKED